MRRFFRLAATLATLAPRGVEPMAWPRLRSLSPLDPRFSAASDVKVRRVWFAQMGSGAQCVARCSVVVYSSQADDSVEDRKNLVRRLWSGARQRIGRSEEREDGKEELDELDSSPVAEEENSALYAELEKRKQSLTSNEDASAAAEAFDDKAIYDALAAKADFPRISKKLNEVVANRSLLFQSSSVGRNSTESFNDFVPSSGQSPGEVITGVLRALRDDGISEEDVQIGGVDTLLKFMSPASELGSADTDPVSVASFFSNSEYDVLLSWDQIVFSALRLSVDGARAYQTTKLKHAKTGQWTKVKWALSLQSPENGGNWLIDSLTIARR